MPRHIIKSGSHPRVFARLVKALVKELVSPSGDSQPLILEQHLKAAKSRHVHVIWGEWEGVADDQRSEIIVEAYTQAEGSAAADISLAIGVTPQEALALGLLPYKVEPASLMDKLEEKAFRHEARHTLLGPGAKELRYATREDAQEAVSRLGGTPWPTKISWVIVKDAERE